MQGGRETSMIDQLISNKRKSMSTEPIENGCRPSQSTAVSERVAAVN